MEEMKFEQIELTPWSENDLQPLIECNSPELMTFLGGPETDEQVLDRHKRYPDGWKNGAAYIFRISPTDLEVGMGVVGYRDITWQDDAVYEARWTILLTWQGRGIAIRAITAILDHARNAHRHRFVHAFPKLEHAASNAVCRTAGF